MQQKSPERPRGASNANEWTLMINYNGRVQTERTSELSPLLWPSPFRWYGSHAWRGPLLARSNHHLGAVRLPCAANPPGAAHSLARSVTWHGPRIFSPSWLNLPTCAKVYVEYNGTFLHACAMRFERLYFVTHSPGTVDFPGAAHQPGALSGWGNATRCMGNCSLFEK